MLFESSESRLEDEGDDLPGHDKPIQLQRNKLLKFIAEDLTEWLNKMEKHLGLPSLGKEPAIMDQFLGFTKERMKRIEQVLYEKKVASGSAH